MTLKERIISLSGDDYRIVRHCDAEIQKVYFFAGLSVPVIYVTCWASSFIVFREVFNSLPVEIALAFFFAWMITNLYRLMIYTFSKNPLPQQDKKTGKLISKLLRLIFLCFITILIAKPLEVTLYADSLDNDVAAFKAEARMASGKKISYYYQQQIREIASLAIDSHYRSAFISKKRVACQQAIRDAETRIRSSGFFLQRLSVLCTRYRSCWWVTFFFLMVFLYPLALRYYLRNCSYNELKRISDQRKVDLNYYVFRKRHASFFEKFHNRRIAFCDGYEDPPYNTVRKEDSRRFLTEEDLINELYHV